MVRRTTHFPEWLLCCFSPLAVKRHVRLRSTMSIKRDEPQRERQSESTREGNNAHRSALPGVPSRETRSCTYPIKAFL